MEYLVIIGTILISGYFFGLVAEKLSLPRVTAYLLAGILISHQFLGQFFQSDITNLSETFSQICLGFIAYIIGGEVNLKKIKSHSSSILLSTLLSSLFPVIFVFISFYIIAKFFNIPEELAIVLAAISSTTAPAATIAVIEQYKARGEVTDMTLGIVILDDALGILIFVLISSIFFPTSSDSAFYIFSREIFLAIGLGTFLGLALSKFAKLSPSNDYLLPLLIGLILLSVGLSQSYHFSSLLTCIFLGVIANSTNIKTCKRVSLLLPIEHLKELFFIIFFVFSGSHFSSTYFVEAIWLIAAYVCFRAIGKYLGAYTGAKLTGVKNKKVPRLLGLTLLPQAGIALGLLIQVVHVPKFAPYKDLLFNIVLGSTIIYEIIGPLVSKFALTKAQEIV